MISRPYQLVDPTKCPYCNLESTWFEHCPKVKRNGECPISCDSLVTIESMVDLVEFKKKIEKKMRELQ